MNNIGDIKNNYLRTDLPELNVGDRIEVTSKKDNRTTNFKGIIIGKKKPGGINYTFSVLKESDRVGIVSVFSYHSPFIKSIKKTGKVNRPVRRAKLTYLEKSMAKKKDNI
jgi:ribosomal protein L19